MFESLNQANSWWDNPLGEIKEGKYSAVITNVTPLSAPKGKQIGVEITFSFSDVDHIAKVEFVFVKKDGLRNGWGIQLFKEMVCLFDNTLAEKSINPLDGKVELSKLATLFRESATGNFCNVSVKHKENKWTDSYGNEKKNTQVEYSIQSFEPSTDIF